MAVLWASNYVFEEATFTQSLLDLSLKHVSILELFGVVQEILVPDNLKSGVNKTCCYDPDPNPSYQQLTSNWRGTIRLR